MDNKTLANEPLICPCCGCGEDNLADQNVEFSDNTVYLDMKCRVCGEEWTDIFKLIDEENSSIPKVISSRRTNRQEN